MAGRRGMGRNWVGIPVACGLVLMGGFLAGPMAAGSLAGASTPGPAKAKWLPPPPARVTPAVPPATPQTAPPAISSVAVPSVTAFMATPAVLSAAGGSVTLSTKVARATSCVFSSTPKISGLPATISCSSGTATKKVTLPANKTTKVASYAITLSAHGSSIITKSVKVSVDPRPTVKSVSPTSGSEAGGTVVTVTGSNLAGATVVNFGTARATKMTVSSSTSLKATSPAGAGTLNVTVTTPGGTSLVSAGDKFTYLPLPVITAISPGAGPTKGGTKVTITGSSLAGATSVRFGTMAGTITADSATSITVTSPAEPVGTVNITVTTLDGASATTKADQFAYSTVINPCTTSVTSDSEIAAGTYVNCSFDVPAGITVSVAPSAVFKFGSNDSITVEGTSTPSAPRQTR
jgi:hypothetical protein